MLVRFVKVAITGCCAVGLILSATRLRIGGGITMALGAADDRSAYYAVSLPEGPDYGVRTAVSTILSSMDESHTVSRFGDPLDPTGVDTPARPGARRPDGWTGPAVVRPENEDRTLWGVPVTHANGSITDISGTRPGGALPERAAVRDDYFEDAVFVGNSLIVGMQKSGVLDTTYYANIGMSVASFFSKPAFPAPDGEKGENGKTLTVTAADTLARDNGFKKVYLLFGINELGWAGSSVFVSLYEDIIDTILAIRPDAIIYVQKILPMNETVYTSGENAYDYFTNARIEDFNREIEALAARKQVFLLDPGTAVADEDGQLPADGTTDGIHLTGAYLRRWADYLKTHTVIPTE